MNTPTCEAACRAFRPAFPMLMKAVAMGIEDIASTIRSAARRGVHYDGALPHMLNEAVIGRAKALIGDQGLIRHPAVGKNQNVFACGNDFAFGFKKMRDGVAANHVSGHQTKLRSGQLVFDFLPKAYWLFVLYDVDEAFTEVKDVRLAAPKGYSANHWSYSIYSEVKQVSEIPLIEQPEEIRMPSKTKIRRKRGGHDSA